MQGEEEDRYVAVIALSTTETTYLFQVRQPRVLPMALHLFLSHPSYYKIGYQVRGRASQPTKREKKIKKRKKGKNYMEASA